MIPLHPLPEPLHSCPFCRERLEVQGWYIPGMRNMADLRCLRCERAFYGDLPVGQAIYTPMLLDKATGEVFHDGSAEWFARWLKNSFARRVSTPIGFTVEHFRQLRTPVLLNCLDTLYGHCLLKLLNVQYYLDRQPALDLIVMVPAALRWMVPEGAAEIWTVDLPLKHGTTWNDWLARQVAARISAMEGCLLSFAFSHPHPDDFAIERFTRVRPFDVGRWETLLSEPKVTFIWREDRLWDDLHSAEARSLKRRLLRRIGVVETPHELQHRRLLALGSTLRDHFPTLNFAVTGMGEPGGLPAWMLDLRSREIDSPLEKLWCQCYAESHLVIGVHGSNMLLPSAHAGAVLELMPHDRWGNILQDIVLAPLDRRELMFRNRIIPATTSPEEVASIARSMLVHHHNMVITMSPEHCDHTRGLKHIKAPSQPVS